MPIKSDKKVQQESKVRKECYLDSIQENKRCHIQIRHAKNMVFVPAWFQERPLLRNLKPLILLVSLLFRFTGHRNEILRKAS